MSGKTPPNVFGDIQGAWAPNPSGINRQSSDVASIDWNNLNYPPKIRLFHFDPSELPTPVARISRALQIASWIASLALILNIIWCIILAAADPKYEWINLLYSVLDCVIGIPIVTYTFYCGYRTLALALTGTLRAFIFFALQAVVLFFSFYFMLSPHGPFHGFIRLGRLTDESPSVAWIFATLTESLLWLAYNVIAIWSSWKIFRFNPYASHGTTPGGMA